MARCLGVYLLLCVSSALLVAGKYCSPGDPCWPTPDEVGALYQALSPGAERQLVWYDGAARVMSVAIGAPDDQPLFGLGKEQLEPLYWGVPDDFNNSCFLPSESPYVSDLCRASTRNFPYEGWMPAFVAWPLTRSHVQVLVKFAADHQLCISVAGTGHDYLNRHSCPFGLFVRTSLMKDKVWDLRPTKDAPYGKVTFGPGNVFSEAHQSAAQHNRVISSGWASTVGVVGWSLGGGHGPFVPAFGTGADNILEVEIVLADGRAVVANKDRNSDIYWALRGGGGSTWGVITAITFRAHPIPQNGFTRAEMQFEGCLSDTTTLEQFMANHFYLIASLNKNIGGFTFVLPSPDPANLTSGQECPDGTWSILVTFVYQGSPDDPEFMRVRENATSILDPADGGANQGKNWYRIVSGADLEPLFPVDGFAYSSSVAALPSVLVSRENVLNGKLLRAFMERIGNCKTEGTCQRNEFYHDLTGAPDSPRDPTTSQSKGFRTSLIHYVLTTTPTSPEDAAKLYTLGENSYFSESAYKQPNNSWQKRYWGSNYKRLLSIKRKYDPRGLFGCHHCVGASGIYLDTGSLYPDN